MDMPKDIVCRLCLRIPQEFVLIDDATVQMLNVLLVKMNFDLSNQPLMCAECAEIAKRSLIFVLMCLNSEKTILAFGIDEDKIDVDLRDVYVHNSKEIFDEDDGICRFCIQKFKETNLVQLEVLLKEHTFADMLKEFVYQMGLNIIKNPLICFHCQDIVESYFKLLWNCLDTEEKINTYRQNEGLRNREKVVLINVFESFVKVGTALLEVSNQELKIETEELIIKDEDTLNEISGQKKNVHRSRICKYRMNQKRRLNKHLLTHKDSSEVQLYHCDSCEYQTKHKGNFNKHLLTHKDFSEVQVYQCDSCSYGTKFKDYLKIHMLTHKDSSEIQLYNCDSCEYRTKYKYHLNSHLLIHKDFADVKLYQCDSCEYRTKYKVCLKKHLLTHRNFSEVQLYQCDSCEYRTKHKSSLKRHLLIHKDSSELLLYQCDSCKFRTEPDFCTNY